MKTRRRVTSSANSKKNDSYASFQNDDEEYSIEEEFIMNKLQNQIMMVNHPFESNGLTDGKPISVLQKSIIYFINNNGGWASDLQIFDFLSQHWSEIMQLSNKRFQLKLRLRLLHINLSAKKKGFYMFIRRDPNSMLYRVNKGKEPQEMDNIDPISDSQDETNQDYQNSSENNSSEDENSENSDKDQDGLNIDMSHRMPFENIIVHYINNHPNGVNERTLIQKLASFENCHGLYQNLNLRMRVRACLIHKKLLKEIYLKENGDERLWTKHYPHQKADKLLFSRETLKSDLPKLTGNQLSLLQERIQRINSLLFP